jgi:hypothetical protein
MFGAYAPLPIRLGGNELQGWTAAQFKRATSDLAAFRRTSESAVFEIDTSDGTIANYFGENGNGTSGEPTPTDNGTGDITLDWDPPIWEDDFDVVHQINIVMADGDGAGTSLVECTVEVVSPSSIRVRTWNAAGAAADGTAIVSVWFFRRPYIGDYGGDVYKEDSKTEGDRPYAWNWYREFQAMRGDAYSQERSGIVHTEHLALARWAGWLYSRLPEEVASNQVPGRSDALLGYWIQVLDLPARADDPAWDLRRKADVKWKALQGSTQNDIDAAFEDLLGTDFASVLRYTGDPLSTPPDITYWPSGVAGPTELDMGGGAWMSYRSHIVCYVSRNLIADPDRLHRLMNSTWFNLADSICPAWMTFSWALDGAGFIIEESLLGYDAI